MAPPVIDLAEFSGWVDGLSTTDRALLGIAGPPGAGKSTVAAMLATARDAPIVGMDGFHLAMDLVEAAGWVDRKGAPFTFDAHGFVALLRRLRRPSPDETIFAPRYDRASKNPIGSAIPIPPDTELVVVEGNYLLHDVAPWDEVRPLLDACAYLEMDDDDRVARLVARHIEFGKAPDHARDFVDHSDEANARIVQASRSRADVVIRVP